MNCAEALGAWRGECIGGWIDACKQYYRTLTGSTNYPSDLQQWVMTHGYWVQDWVNRNDCGENNPTTTGVSQNYYKPVNANQPQKMGTPPGKYLGCIKAYDCIANLHGICSDSCGTGMCQCYSGSSEWTESYPSAKDYCESLPPEDRDVDCLPQYAKNYQTPSNGWNYIKYTISASTLNSLTNYMNGLGDIIPQSLMPSNITFVNLKQKGDYIATPDGVVYPESSYNCNAISYLPQTGIVYGRDSNCNWMFAFKGSVNDVDKITLVYQILKFTGKADLEAVIFNGSCYIIWVHYPSPTGYPDRSEQSMSIGYNSGCTFTGFEPGPSFAPGERSYTNIYDWFSSIFTNYTTINGTKLAFANCSNNKGFNTNKPEWDVFCTSQGVYFGQTRNGSFTVPQAGFTQVTTTESTVTKTTVTTPTTHSATVESIPSVSTPPPASEAPVTANVHVNGNEIVQNPVTTTTPVTTASTVTTPITVKATTLSADRIIELSLLILIGAVSVIEVVK